MLERETGLDTVDLTNIWSIEDSVFIEVRYIRVLESAEISHMTIIISFQRMVSIFVSSLKNSFC